MGIHFKVVAVDLPLCNSATTRSENWCVHYQIGIKTLPKIKHSKLFAFSSLETARYWARWVHNTRQLVPIRWEIYRCIAENPTPAKRCSRMISDIDLIDFWATDHHELLDVILDVNPPFGTHWADSITLTQLTEVINPKE